MIMAKSGVQFAQIAPAGFRLISAIERTSRLLNVDLVITSGTDGFHSGPNDPHKRGCAFDVRSRTLEPEQVKAVLRQVLLECADGDEAPTEKADGLVTEKFFGFHEGAQTPNAHLHFQLRMGKVYP